MTDSLHSRLSPIHRRQLIQSIVAWTAFGLLAGSVISIGIGAIRLMSGWADGSLIGLAIVFAGPLLALITAVAWLLPRPNWIAAARAIDQHYRLKDRTESALDFSSRQVSREKLSFAELQLADAIEHLQKVDPQAVAPWKSPRLLPGALVAAIVAVVLALVPLKPTALAAAASVPDEQIVEQAEEIAETLQELEEEIQQDSDPELDQLLKELKEKTEQMKEPGVDVKEALAKISEMQAAIQSVLSQSSLEQVDLQLHEIGEAMASAKALQGAGQALAEGKYDKAARDLAELEDLEFDRKEARNTAEKLKKAARRSNNGDVGNGTISDAANEIADGIENDDSDATKSGARKLGEQAKKQARKKKINDLLNGELDELTDAKCNCQNNSTTKGKKKQKSTSPSTNWGMSASGNIDGDATQLNSAVNREEISGTAGDGESEFETSSSSEGRQEGQRGYKQIYQKYKKMSDAVLESEQIPLGHRQTIRKYFESIRPQQSDSQPDDK